MGMVLGQRPSVFCVLVVCLGVAARGQRECLDQMSSGRRCCTPSAFTKLSFKLRLNSVAEGCDSPSYLDQGVRLEVRRPRHNWEPVRFYTATLESRNNSLIRVLSGGTHVADENNLHFPLLVIQGTGPLTVSEYLCGTEYYTAGTEYRWLQQYNNSATDGEDTWSLGEVSVTYNEGGRHCSALLTKYHFRNGNGSSLDNFSWTPPACEQDIIQPDTLYFTRLLEVDGLSQRSVLLTPTWWNANCSVRTSAGCELSEECRTITISDQLCSVGTELHCQCQFPQVPGHDNICFHASVGFERAMYDVSEHETAEVCIILLNGTLLENINVRVTSKQGTAKAMDFIRLDTTVTLTPTEHRTCVSISIRDDSTVEDTMEDFTVSLTGPQDTAVLLSRSTATISIIDNDVVKIIMDSDTIEEGQKLSMKLRNEGNERILYAVKTISGTALQSSDFTPRNVNFQLNAGESRNLPPVNASPDAVWEGYENFQLSVGGSERTYTKRLFIMDANELQVGFDDNYYAVRENDSLITVCVTVQQGHIGENSTLSLGVRTKQIPGSAQEVLDYRGISTVITFSSSVSGNCLTLVVIDDNGTEKNETLLMSLFFLQDTHNVNFTQESVTVEIIDDDVMKIGFVSSVYSASEGLAYVTVCVEVKEGSLSVPANLSMSSYNKTTGLMETVILSMDEDVMCRNIMFDDDMTYEETEVLSLSLTLTGEQSSAVELCPDTATVYVIDDDELTLGIRMNTTVPEAVGSVDACIEILSGDLGTEVIVQVITLDGTAEDGVDYTGLPATDVYLNSAHDQSCVSVSILDDLIFEDTEFLNVSLTILGPKKRFLTLSQDVYIVYITNDDDLYIGFEQSAYTVSERDSSVTVCIEVKDGILGASINVAMSVDSFSAQANSDFQGLDNTLTLQPPLPAPLCVIAVAIRNDIAFEDIETLSLSLTLLDVIRVNITQPRAIISITDDDMVTVGFDQRDYTVSEAIQLLPVCVTVRNGTRLGTDLILHVESRARTAEENKDYLALSRNLTLPSTTSKHCFSVEILNDTALEQNEMMTMFLSLAEVKERVQILPLSANVFITDDDELVIGFKHENYTVQEGHKLLEVSVAVLSGKPGTEVVLKLCTKSGAAIENMDYRGLSTRITFSENVLENIVFLNIIDDKALEWSESLSLHLTLDEVTDRIQISPQSAVVVIADDDELTVGFTRNNYTVSEDEGVVEVCVDVHKGELGSDLTLQLNTESGTAADGIDFGGLQETLNLNSNTSNVCVQILTMNDRLYEDKEFFTVSFSVIGQESKAINITQSSSTIFIENDDNVFVDFTSSYYSTNESAGGIDVCVSVVMGQLGTNITLELNTLGGTARVVDDFVEVRSNVVLTPSNLEDCVRVSIVEDEAVEWSETISLSLSQLGTSDTALNVSEKPVLIDITDDDVAFIEVEAVAHYKDTFRLVEICAVTNNTLERTFNLSVVAVIAMDFENDTLYVKPVQLEPSVTRACIEFNITFNQELSFNVLPPVGGEVIKPNGTILSEPSFSGILELLEGSDVNLLAVVEKLEEIVNTLIENEQIASFEFSNTFVDVVSKVLDVTNESPEVSQKEDMTNSKPLPGTSLLMTMDKFALQSFDSSYGAITSNNTRIKVLDINEAEKEFVTSISGPEDEMIEIQSDIFQKYNVSVTVGSYYLRNVSGLLPTTLHNISDSELVSPVLSSDLRCENRTCDLINTTEVVRISLHHRPLKDSEEQRCVFYNLKTNRWSEDGCTVSNESNSTMTVCSCNHLTHFAVMLSPKNSVNEQDAYNMRLIGYVGISISVTCLLIIIVIFSTFKSLWSMRNYIHVNLSISLLIAQLLFVVGVDKTQNQIACQTIAVVLHYAFLVTFMWMLMEGVVLYVALVRVFVTKPHRYIIGFTVLSYGLPLVYMALVVPLGFLLSHGPHYGGDICWLRYDTHFVWALTSPVIVIILANVGFFFMAIYIIWKQQARKNLSTSQIQKAKHWLKVSVSLLVVMGIAWIIGVVTFHEALLFVSYIFTVIVAFQGAIMFIMFVLLSKQVRLTLKKWFVRNVIMKSDYLSEHFSDFTRSTQAGYSQSHSSGPTKSTVSQGIQLGVFMALPAKPSVAELQKQYEADFSSSLPPTALPSPSPAPSTPYASSCNSPLPPPSHLEEEVTDDDEGSPNTFTVIYVTNDKDSGRGSPDTDTICTSPPDNSPSFDPLSVCDVSGTKTP